MAFTLSSAIEKKLRVLYNQTMKFLFDCDDTLYDLSWPFAQCIKEFDLPVSDLDTFYASYRAFGDAIFDKIQSGELSVDESGEYRIEQACLAYGIPWSHEKSISFQKRYRYYQTQISMSDILYRFFQKTTSECGILTNGQDTHQRNKLRYLKVFECIPEDHIFTSGQIGFSKPDPRAFQAVMTSLQEKPEDWMYIGDHYENDIQGAKEAGLHTLHFNRHHRQEGPCADLVVYTEEELVSALERLERE